MDDESESAQDARVQVLWKKLDVDGRGFLDINGLRKGLTRIDHPLKNADDLLQDILKTIDTNQDGRISYSEFESFVLQTERELLSLYKSIDRNNDGKVVKGELRAAFQSAGLTVSQEKLDRFFDRIDTDHNGDISFKEWRNFLLFIPMTSPDLKGILSYFSATVRLSPEGDVLITDDAIQGLGYFIAGGTAGVISRTATAPLDRLKVYLIAQTGGAKESLEAAKSGALIHALKGAWRTSATAMKDLWAAGGIRSLYAGNGLNIIKVMPESAIKFGTYEASKRICARIEGHNSPKQNSAASKFISGGVSGMASQFFVYPLDTLKFRMQCETVTGGLRGNRLIFETAKKMWNETGYRAFYRGLPMGLIGMFPYAAIDLGTFEYLKRAITLRNARIRNCHEDDATPSSFSTALIGGFSGALGASIVYPLNLLRTRLQSQGTVLHPRTYTGIMDVFHQTMKGEGVRGLFKGLTPNLLKVVPAVSITYVVYENAKKQLNLR